MIKNRISESRVLLYSSLVLTFICGFTLTVLIDPVLVKISGFGIIHLEFAQNPAQLLLILQSWGADGRSFLLQWIWIDYIFPAAYGTFLFIVLRRSLNFAFPESPALGILSLLPLLASVMDWAENSAEIYMMRYVQEAAKIFTLHRFFVYTKWAAVFLALIILVVVLATGIYKKQKRRLSL